MVWQARPEAEIATFDAEGAQGKAQGTWSELAARIKIAQAQRLYLHGNRKLTLEILDLMSRLEKLRRCATPTVWRRSRT